ncbi:MAG: LysM peptidoglycan-binding domain-containing protein, partial [Gemmatimonadaceae bacterium]|nr:LysM peptidoglycan-binding domain-containing protein [Gemmatimonadaceae bacterium]
MRVASASAPQTRPATGGGAARSHVVAEGETLWSLATRYLGDGHRWEEIAALNRSVVASARTLPAGTRLILPGDAADALPTKVSNGVAELPKEGGASLDEFYARFAGRTVFFGVQRSTAVLVPPPTLGLQSAGAGSEPSVVRAAPARSSTVSSSSHGAESRSRRSGPGAP